jgi:hypothetical protein
MVAEVLGLGRRTLQRNAQLCVQDHGELTLAEAELYEELYDSVRQVRRAPPPRPAAAARRSSAPRMRACCAPAARRTCTVPDQATAAES